MPSICINKKYSMGKGVAHSLVIESKRSPQEPEVRGSGGGAPSA